MTWLSKLQPASWRGNKFGVMDSEVRRGRRTATHEYPFRDVVWVEDLGRATRRYGFRGFYVGDDCYDVEKKMLKAAELAGPGELIHPSLGSLKVSLVEFSSGQRRELGRVVEFQFGFIEGAAGPLFPQSTESTQDVTATAADNADTAAQGDFFDQVGAALQSGTAAVNSALKTVNSAVSAGLGIVHDANRLVGSVNGLGSLLTHDLQLGRFSAGRIGPRGLAGPLGSVLGQVQGITSAVGRVEAGANAAILNAIQLGNSVSDAGNDWSHLTETL